MPLTTYDFSTFGPAEALQLQIEAGGVSIRDRQFILAATLFPSNDAGVERISPGDLSWPYSHSLDTSFAYLPKSDGDAPFELLRELTSTTPFSRVRLEVVDWATPRGESVPGSAFGRVLFAVRSASTIKGLTKHPMVYGTSDPTEEDA